jgi:hypothetical protein
LHVDGGDDSRPTLQSANRRCLRALDRAPSSSKGAQARNDTVDIIDGEHDRARTSMMSKRANSETSQPFGDLAEIGQSDILLTAVQFH